MSQRGNAELFQIRVGQLGKDPIMDIIFGEDGRILTEAELFQPSFDASGHVGNREFSVSTFYRPTEWNACEEGALCWQLHEFKS